MATEDAPISLSISFHSLFYLPNDDDQIPFNEWTQTVIYNKAHDVALHCLFVHSIAHCLLQNNWCYSIESVVELRVSSNIYLVAKVAEHDSQWLAQGNLYKYQSGCQELIWL